jgi:serine/threonine-protein kinase
MRLIWTRTSGALAGLISFRVLLLVGCAVLCCAIDAKAEGSRADKAAAEALFDRGLALLRAREYAEACAKLEASERIDPGVGTLLYLGTCYERLGRTASAWATFREASSLAQSTGQPERAELARDREQRLAPDLAYVIISVSSEARIPDLVVRRAGSVVGSDLYGIAIPTDPGEVTITASAPGYETSSSVLTLHPRDKQSFTIPILRRSESERPLRIDKSPPVRKVVVNVTPEPASTHSSFGTTKIVACAIGGAGLLALGAGSYFGIRAIRKNHDAERQNDCSGNTCPDARGVSATDQALDSARAANVAFAAGGAMLIFGALLYAVAPSASERHVAVAPALFHAGSGLSLAGKFE